MTESDFYSDNVGRGKPRVSEIISIEAWSGLTSLIQQRVNDGSLARAFPQYTCPEDPGRNAITGTDEEEFLRSLRAHVPELVESPAVLDDDQGSDSGARDFFASHTPEPSRCPLDPDKVPDTTTALDVVDFVALHIDKPIRRSSHGWGFDHIHFSFEEQLHDSVFDAELTPGQVQFRRDINRLFTRNGIAYEIGRDMRVRRLGPPEAQPLISEFRPSTGDLQLDGKLMDAMARFLSRKPGDPRDALEKLWDAFERLKTLELGGDTLKKQSANQLVTCAASGSESFRALLDAEFTALTDIGNKFTIRHHEHGQGDLPTDDAINYLFLRLASLISLVLRHTGRMGRVRFQE